MQLWEEFSSVQFSNAFIFEEWGSIKPQRRREQNAYATGPACLGSGGDKLPTTMGKTKNADGTENPSLKFFTPLTKQGLFNVTLRCKRRATGNQGQQVLEGEQCLYP